MERQLSQEDIDAKVSDYLDEIERKLDPRYRKDVKTAIAKEIKNHLKEKVASIGATGTISRLAIEKILAEFGTPDEIVSEYVPGESEKDEQGELSLQVAEINKASAGRGLCSAGIHVARQLSLKAGEIVEISGKKTTGCIYFPNSEDEGKQIIRIDGLVRLNAGAGLAEFVKIRRARPKPADRVVIAPTDTTVQVQPRNVRDSLMNRPVVKGDHLLLKNMYNIGLVVQETMPGGEIVQITPNTVLEKITEGIAEDITAGITEDDVREALKQDFGEDVAKRFTIKRIDRKNA